jgi:hypothetical protein
MGRSDQMRFTDEADFDRFRREAEAAGYGRHGKPAYKFVMMLLDEYLAAREGRRILDRVEEKIREMRPTTPEQLKETLNAQSRTILIGIDRLLQKYTQGVPAPGP